jgi:hypothetical protein
MNNIIGCKDCENFWLKYPKKQPYPLTDKLAEQITLYQCTECWTYWEEDLRTSHIINSEQA